MSYQVIIIEDDPMVADIDRQYVEMNRAFRVVQTFKSSADAIDFLSGGALKARPQPALMLPGTGIIRPGTPSARHTYSR